MSRVFRHCFHYWVSAISQRSSSCFTLHSANYLRQNSYGTFFFSISGITNPFVISVITGVCGIVGSAAAFPFIKYFGRRPILICGAAAQSISMLTFAIVGVAAPGSKAAAQCLSAFVSLFIFSYGSTWGAVGPVVLGELSSTKLRSKTLALCYVAGWSADLLIICGIPYLISPQFANLGAKVGFIFGGIQVLVFIWSFFYLPGSYIFPVVCSAFYTFIPSALALALTLLC